jgi:hypothetical protein
VVEPIKTKHHGRRFFSRPLQRKIRATATKCYSNLFSPTFRAVKGKQFTTPHDARRTRPDPTYPVKANSGRYYYFPVVFYGTIVVPRPNSPSTFCVVYDDEWMDMAAIAFPSGEVDVKASSSTGSDSIFNGDLGLALFLGSHKSAQ